MRVRAYMLVGALFGLAAAPAIAQNGAKAGLLSCSVGASVGLIVGSRQHMHCRFDPDNSGHPEDYSGTITRVGLDVGIRGGSVMGWAVYAPSTALSHHALRGRYVGASETSPLALVGARNSLWADRTRPSHYSRSHFPAKSASISLSEWPA